MPIKRNVYIQSARDHTVKQAESHVAKIAPTRQGFDTVDEMLAAIKARQAKVETTKEARYTLSDGVSVFRSLWPRLTKQHYPGTIPDVILVNRHVPRIKRQIIVPLREADVVVSTFLNFLFENWLLCRHNRAFRSFKFYPPAPALDWMLKYSALYIRIMTDHHMGFSVEDEEVEKPKPAPKEDKTKLARVVRAADAKIKAQEREIAKLRTENSRLQIRKPRRIPSGTATNGKAIPDWD